MHTSSMLRMTWFEKDFASKLAGNEISILDVGSYSVNGSYKGIFSDHKYKYTGMDMSAGPNVDLVLPNPYDWSRIPSDTYDVVISGQAFEHVEDYTASIFFKHKRRNLTAMTQYIDGSPGIGLPINLPESYLIHGCHTIAANRTVWLGESINYYLKLQEKWPGVATTIGDVRIRK